MIQSAINIYGFFHNTDLGWYAEKVDQYSVNKIIEERAEITEMISSFHDKSVFIVETLDDNINTVAERYGIKLS